MWPKSLQMSRDECRGILRRLELESYSQIVNVFRAQGGLNENKLKLLEQLRAVCHISQDRHRAESRRVVNDEELGAIAETLSGPNTWQDWSREGKRTYPLLPRVAPRTAVTLYATQIANSVKQQNANLPEPSETGKIYEERQAALAAAQENDIKPFDNVVTEEPFKVPDIPVGVAKKNLKRSSLNSQTANKKRQSNELSKATLSKQNVTGNIPNLQKLRYFHQQQVAKQKANAKKAAAAAKRQATAGGKTGRKAQRKLQQKVLQSDDMQFLPSVDLPTHMPQIAASKKDITKNFTKLQKSAQHESKMQELSSHIVSTHAAYNRVEKQLLSTPVQKYIVEDRQPILNQGSATASQHILSNTKLRTMNAAILSPNKNNNMKKLSSATNAGGSPVFNMHDGTPAHPYDRLDDANPNAQSLGNATSHALPTVMQLHNNNNNKNNNNNSNSGSIGIGEMSPQSTQVINAKNVASNAGINAPAANAAPNPTIIKNLQSVLLPNSQSSCINNTLISPLNPNVTPPHRKPNILKTSPLSVNSATASATSKPNPCGPQIISNIKLTPAINPTPLPTVTSTLSQPQFITQNINKVTTGIRPGLKICHSLNGKVFIQPANVDATGKLKLQGVVQPKIIPTTSFGTLPTISTATSSTSSSSQSSQRINIQKVQIIQPPTGSPNAQSLQQQQQQQQKPPTVTLSNKNNMFLLPANVSRNTITIPRGSGFIPSGIINRNRRISIDVCKPNVVVIGSNTLSQIHKIPSNRITVAATATSTAKNEHSPIITEDTPVDIIVDNAGSVVTGTATSLSETNNIGDTVTMISPNLVESQSQQQTMTPTTVYLPPTDWEMELDQASAQAAANKVQVKQQQPQFNKNNNLRHMPIKTQKSQPSITILRQEEEHQGVQAQHIMLDKNLSQSDPEETIIIDDTFEDVIVEEAEESEGTIEMEDEDVTNDENDVIILDEDDKQMSAVEQQMAHEETEENLMLVEDQVERQQMTHRQNTHVMDDKKFISESEADAGFDESLAADYTEDIEENTTIDYIEEDNNIIMQCKKNADIFIGQSDHIEVVEMGDVQTTTSIKSIECANNSFDEFTEDNLNNLSTITVSCSNSPFEQ